MPNWLPLAAIVVLLFAVAPIFNNKAIEIHGPVIHFLIVNIIFLILGFAWFFFSGGQEEFDLVNKKSLGLTTISSFCAFIGIAITFSIYEMSPRELPIIAITTGFSVVVLAIISHFLGDKLTFHQWLGAIIAFLGIVLVNWKK